MNTLFKRWIREAVDSTDGNFTSKTILDKIIYKRGNRSSIGTAPAVGWLLARMPNVEKVRDGVYRRKENED